MNLADVEALTGRVAFPQHAEDVPHGGQRIAILGVVPIEDEAEHQHMPTSDAGIVG
jgi:hypothetical protein